MTHTAPTSITPLLQTLLTAGALVVGGCAVGDGSDDLASASADDLVVELDGKADGAQPVPVGSFRPMLNDPAETTVGFSGLVLRSDGTYYAEFCNDLPSSAACQAGLDPLYGPRPVGTEGLEWSGNVQLSWGTYRRLVSPSTGKRYLELSGRAAPWVFSYDGAHLRLWRDQPELGEPEPNGDRVTRMVAAEPICWTDTDCSEQGFAADDVVCMVTDAQSSAGTCASLDSDERLPEPLGTYRPMANDAAESEVGFSSLVFNRDGTYYAEFCNGLPSSAECQVGHEAFGPQPTGEAGLVWSGDVQLSWGRYELLSSPTSNRRYVALERGEPYSTEFWATSFDGSVLRLWRDQTELGEPDPNGTRVTRMVAAAPTCWVDADCGNQSSALEDAVCMLDSTGPGECTLLD
jgi:hypothetical protein